MSKISGFFNTKAIPVLLLFISLIMANSSAILRDIRFKGKFPFDRKVLQKQLLLKPGNAVTPKSVNESQKRLIAFLNRKGYLEARIDSIQKKIEKKDSTKVDLVFWVNSGLLYRVDSVAILSDSIPAEQYRRLMEVRPNSPFDQDKLQQDIKRLINFAADAGFPLISVSVLEPKIKRDPKKPLITPRLRIKEGPAIYVKGIYIQGNRYTRPEVVLREIYFKPGMRYKQSWKEKIVSRLEKLQIFKSISAPDLVRVGRDSVLIVIPVEEGNSTVFDGVVGYIPETKNLKNKGGYLTGLLDISFKNLFGTGRKLKIYWEKTDRLSENFDFQYLEPWVAGQPVDMGLSFSREVRDTVYIAWDLKITSNFNLSENFSLFVNFNRHSVNPDSGASFDLGLLKNRVYGLETGIRYDTRDYPLNPLRGVFYKSSYVFGLKQNLGPRQIILRDSVKKRVGLNSLNLRFEWYQPLFKNQVFAFKLTTKHIRGNHLQLSDYFWFGGSRSVRGYREKQFSGYLVGWLNLEYRFISGRNSRMFLFTDWGYFEQKIAGVKKKKLLRGMGLGLRFDTPLGIMGIDYGLAKGEGFRQGKIHFGLTNQF